jgi:hypothetical protein
MEYKTFNLNSTVLVKLNHLGYKILCCNEKTFAKENPKYKIKNKTLQEFKNDADENGYTKFQMWVFMREFGKYAFCGSDNPYSLDILIQESDLK